MLSHLVRWSFSLAVANETSAHLWGVGGQVPPHIMAHLLMSDPPWDLESHCDVSMIRKSLLLDMVYGKQVTTNTNYWQEWWLPSISQTDRIKKGTSVEWAPWLSMGSDTSQLEETFFFATSVSFWSLGRKCCWRLSVAICAFLPLLTTTLLALLLLSNWVIELHCPHCSCMALAILVLWCAERHCVLVTWYIVGVRNTLGHPDRLAEVSFGPLSISLIQCKLYNTNLNVCFIYIPVHDCK